MKRYPRTPEEREQLDCKVEETSCQMKEEEKYWARIEKEGRAADILSTLSLVFSIIVLLITLAK